MVLLSKRVKLVPNRTMQTVLDKNCDYRRYCWNQGLALWEDTYTARDYMLPDSIKEKVKLELKGEKVSFTEEEMALRAVYPAPSERKVRDQLVEEKADWQYSYSARILQLAIKDLSIAYRSYYTKATERWGRPKFKSKKDTKQGEDRITLSGNQKHGTKHHEYICYECGFTCHRDENAVLNLLALAN